MIDLDDLFPGHVKYDLSTLIDEDVGLGILASGPNEPSSDINLAACRFELARLFEDTFRANATSRLSSAVRGRLRTAVKSIETYVELARKFRHTDFPPPLPPPDWVRHVRIWQASIDDAHPEGNKGGSPPAEWIATFYPRALAMYRVVFEVEPTGSINEVEEKSSPAVQFIMMLLEEMSLINLGHPYKDQTPSPLIGERKLSAISKCVRSVLELELAADTGETDYRRWCRLYRSGQEHRLTRDLT
jgi:hypothetical protein